MIMSASVFLPVSLRILVDPFISGIYAGDIKRLHMASAFPKLKRKGFKKSRMRSFKGGMGKSLKPLINVIKNISKQIQKYLLHL